MDLDQGAAELYSLVPGDFTARRDELAAQARTDGDRELAAQLKKLRRPTVAAWAVNLLVREAAGEVDELLGLGEALREAQSQLDGARMRELGDQRHRQIAALAGRAAALAAGAGAALQESARTEVEATLGAAVADEAAATAVSTGRLTKALSYSGLGEVDIADAVAGSLRAATKKQPARKQPAKKQPAKKQPAKKQPAKKQVPDRTAERAAERTRAQRSLADSETALAAATKTHEDLHRRREELLAELERVERQEKSALHAAREARRVRDLAERALRRAGG